MGVPSLGVSNDMNTQGMAVILIIRTAKRGVGSEGKLLEQARPSLLIFNIGGLGEACLLAQDFTKGKRG